MGKHQKKIRKEELFIESVESYSSIKLSNRRRNKRSKWPQFAATDHQRSTGQHEECGNELLPSNRAKHPHDNKQESQKQKVSENSIRNEKSVIQTVPKSCVLSSSAKAYPQLGVCILGGTPVCSLWQSYRILSSAWVSTAQLCSVKRFPCAGHVLIDIYMLPPLQ